MHLKLITPEKLILDEAVDSITLPGIEGQMTILPGHTMLVSQLISGKMHFKKQDTEGKEVTTTRTIGPGFMEIQKDNVVVLTTSVVTI